jgi:hypothetical protein
LDSSKCQSKVYYNIVSRVPADRTLRTKQERNMVVRSSSQLVTNKVLPIKGARGTFPENCIDNVAIRGVVPEGERNHVPTEGFITTLEDLWGTPVDDLEKRGSIVVMTQGKHSCVPSTLVGLGECRQRAAANDLLQ